MREKIIKRFTVVLDSNKLDLITGFVLARISYPPNAQETFQVNLAEELAKIPNVVAVHIVTGTNDLLIEVKGRSWQEVSSTILNRIRSKKGVNRTETAMALTTTKEDYIIPL